MRAGAVIEVDGRKLALSELSRIVFPETGISKWGVIAYYAKIASTILPHLRNRPIPFQRHLDTADRAPILEARFPLDRPEWIRICRLETEISGREQEYCLVDDTASLLWLVNSGVIELRTLAVPCDHAEHPLAAHFRLEPVPPATIYDCMDAARLLRQMLQAVDLKSFAKSDGGIGIHLHVPLDGSVDADEVRTFAHAMAILLRREHPNTITSTLRSELRDGRVFLDWSANTSRSAIIAPYSLRAAAGPCVSAPLAWEELDSGRTRSDARNILFGMEDVLTRIRTLGDLYAETLIQQQSLPMLG